MLPDVRAAGPGVAVGPDDLADRVVAEPGGEHVGRAVAAGVRDQDDRPVVLLADQVALLGRCERDPLRVDGSGLERLPDRVVPGPEVGMLFAKGQGLARVDELCRLRLDRVRRE